MLAVGLAAAAWLTRYDYLPPLGHGWALVKDGAGKTPVYSVIVCVRDRWFNTVQCKREIVGDISRQDDVSRRGDTSSLDEFERWLLEPRPQGKQ